MVLLGLFWGNSGHLGIFSEQHVTSSGEENALLVIPERAQLFSVVEHPRGGESELPGAKPLRLLLQRVSGRGFARRRGGSLPPCGRPCRPFPGTHPDEAVLIFDRTRAVVLHAPDHYVDDAGDKNAEPDGGQHRRIPLPAAQPV